MSVTEIGRRLKKARLDAKLTQKEVADKLGITYQAISNYERGTNRVDMHTLTKLCNIYRIEVSSLFCTPAWTDDMISAYRSAATNEQRDTYLKMWGTPAELLEEVNSRREPDSCPLTPEDEMVLFKYHRGEIPVLCNQEHDLILKFRQLNAEGQTKILEYINDLLCTGIYKNVDSHPIQKDA